MDFVFPKVNNCCISNFVCTINSSLSSSMKVKKSKISIFVTCQVVLSVFSFFISCWSFQLCVSVWTAFYIVILGFSFAIILGIVLTSHQSGIPSFLASVTSFLVYFLVMVNHSFQWFSEKDSIVGTCFDALPVCRFYYSPLILDC